METKNQDKTLLNEFLQIFEQIPSEIVKSLLRVTVDEDEKNVINAFAPTLQGQFKELSLYITDISTKASKQNVVEVDRFLKVSSAVSLANNLKIAMPSIGSVIGKLGISGIIMEIKKIIYAILDILGITLPKWLDKLINLIDEIIHDLFGGASLSLRNTLSHMEQNYLAELTLLSRLEKANEDKFTNKEREEL